MYLSLPRESDGKLRGSWRKCRPRNSKGPDVDSDGAKAVAPPYVSFGNCSNAFLSELHPFFAVELTQKLPLTRNPTKVRYEQGCPKCERKFRRGVLWDSKQTVITH